MSDKRKAYTSLKEANAEIEKLKDALDSARNLLDSSESRADRNFETAKTLEKRNCLLKGELEKLEAKNRFLIESTEVFKHKYKMLNEAIKSMAHSNDKTEFRIQTFENKNSAMSA